MPINVPPAVHQAITGALANDQQLDFGEVRTIIQTARQSGTKQADIFKAVEKLGGNAATAAFMRHIRAGAGRPVEAGLAPKSQGAATGVRVGGARPGIRPAPTVVPGPTTVAGPTVVSGPTTIPGPAVVSGPTAVPKPTVVSGPTTGAGPAKANGAGKL